MLIRHRLSHDVVECHIYPEMLAGSAPMLSRADLATTADSAGTRSEQRVSAPLPVVSGARLASHQRGVLARWSSPAGRASCRAHSMTSPTEQWIRGRERRTPKAPLVLVVKRSCRRARVAAPSRRAISHDLGLGSRSRHAWFQQSRSNMGRLIWRTASDANARSSAINKTAAPSAATSSTTDLTQRHLPSCGQARRQSPRTRPLRRAAGQDPRRDRLCPVRHRYQVGR